MTVYNLGSINLDHFYQVPHLPEPGETLAATRLDSGLGGKGANQSVAVAQGGSAVFHVGMVGADGGWVKARLAELGVDVSGIATSSRPTGHANVHVDTAGENMIVTYPGANHDQGLDHIAAVLAGAGPGDIFMLQNEVSQRVEAARMAREKGMFVVYAAAPFKPEVAEAMLPYVDLLVLNEIEAEQLSAALGQPIDEIPVPHILVTRGSDGAGWRDQATGEVTQVASFPVVAVDTTGAGDCFTGYVVAGLDQGLAREDALRLAAAASALHVTRPGTADAIPTRAEVDAFLAAF